MPFCLSSLERFRKKLTVMGMIGQMQGMQTASRPPTKPISSRYNKEWLAMLSPAPKARNSLMTGCHSASSVTGETTAALSDWVVAAVSGVTALTVSALFGVS